MEEGKELAGILLHVWSARVLPAQIPANATDVDHRLGCHMLAMTKTPHKLLQNARLKLLLLHRQMVCWCLPARTKTRKSMHVRRHDGRETEVNLKCTRAGGGFQRYIYSARPASFANSEHACSAPYKLLGDLAANSPLCEHCIQGGRWHGEHREENRVHVARVTRVCNFDLHQQHPSANTAHDG